MDYKNFFTVSDKNFKVLDDQTTVCRVVCKLYTPIDINLLSDDMRRSVMNNITIAKNVAYEDGAFIIKTCAEAVLKNGDTFNASEGERISYLKAKQMAVHKAKQVYDFIVFSLVSQYHDYLSSIYRKLDRLDDHLAEYVHELKTR